jgi:hypothetical protein
LESLKTHSYRPGFLLLENDETDLLYEEDILHNDSTNKTQQQKHRKAWMSFQFAQKKSFDLSMTSHESPD